MILIETGEKYALSWLDIEKTILHLDIQKGWTWEDAHTALAAINREIMMVQHDVYSIYQFQPNAAVLPTQLAGSNIKQLLLNTEVDNEAMIILVSAGSFIAQLMSLLSSVYSQLSRNTSKVHKIEQALELIKPHKSTT